MKPDLEAKRLFLEAAVRLGERFKVERDMGETQRTQRCTWAIYIAGERVATIRDCFNAPYFCRNPMQYIGVGHGVIRGVGARKPIRASLLYALLWTKFTVAIGAPPLWEVPFGADLPMEQFNIPPLLPVHRGRPQTVQSPSELSARWARAAVAELGGSRRAEVITGIPASTLRQATRGARGLSAASLQRLQDALVDDDLAEFLAVP